MGMTECGPGSGSSSWRGFWWFLWSRRLPPSSSRRNFPWPFLAPDRDGSGLDPEVALVMDVVVVEKTMGKVVNL